MVTNNSAISRVIDTVLDAVIMFTVLESESENYTFNPYYSIRFFDSHILSLH